MSTNRQKIKERKALKKKQRTKEINKRNNIRKNNTPKLSNGYRNPMEGIDVNNSAEINTKDLLKAVSDTISIVAPSHAAIEILETLVKEGTVEPVTIEEQAIIDDFDKAVVKYAEDVRAVNEFVDMGKEPVDYIEIIFSLANNTNTLVTDLLPELMEDDKLLGRNKKVLDQYVNEHKTEEDNYLDFAFRVHNNRIMRIFDKYKTTEIIETDEEFKSLVDELPEIEDAEFEEVYEIKPTTIKDAEDAGPLNS